MEKARWRKRAPVLAGGWRRHPRAKAELRGNRNFKPSELGRGSLPLTVDSVDSGPSSLGGDTLPMLSRS